MKGLKISLLIFVMLSFIGEATSALSQEHYSTLTGTVALVRGGLKKELDVKGDDTEVVVPFRIGRKTVFIPHRYPNVGERVKVEYQTIRGVNVAYTVTILENRDVVK